MFKVLLVDDEPDFLVLMEQRIRSWGYDFVKASNGKEALQMIKNESPDLVILDYMMPDMDGIDVLKNIRKTNTELPVIMFTAYPDEKSMSGSQNLGVSAFIPKLSLYSDVQLSLQEVIKMVREKKLKKN